MVMRIGIAGCAGRMGRMLLKETLNTPGCRLAAGSVPEGSSEAGQDLGALAGLEPVGIAATAGTEPLVAASDAVIDFTAPELTVELARTCAAQGRALVTGTTGLNETQQKEIAALAQRACIVQASNMSLGVNLLLGVVEGVAGLLDERYDIEIVEMHHRYKADAPSGTALMLGEAAASGRGVSLGDAACHARGGQTGARLPGQIGFASLRGGDVVGEHTVIFAGEGERIEFTHRASGRQVFTRGALKAALWTKGRPPGLYSMRDVLSI